MNGPLRNPRLIALCAAGWALLNYPLLTLWDRGGSLSGLPLMPLALFGGWALLIGLAACIAEAGASDGDDGPGDGDRDGDGD